jgi:hypothetical protein
MSTFSWRFEASDGSAVAVDDAPDKPFVSRADAESWIGESWRALVASGVEQATLLHDGTPVYGPMSLAPE